MPSRIRTRSELRKLVGRTASSLHRPDSRQLGYASMSAPTKKLEELVLSGKLRHAGNPVLRWMAGNVSIEQDAADNWKPSKKKSRERIDGIVALVMALDLAGQHAERRSIFEEPGNLIL